jgi:Tol biopolymer transport system component
MGIVAAGCDRTRDRGDKIVFAGLVVSAAGLDQAEIYTMNPDGSDRQRLTRSPELDSKPEWSPDGQRIVFERCCVADDSDIYVMDADGSNLRKLTPPGTDEYDPTWSPDGERIAFWRVDPEFVDDGIYVMNADGTEQRNLTPRTSGEPGPPDAARDSTPAWSPDGRKIAFERSSDDLQTDIYVMNADGTAQRNVTMTPGEAVNEFEPVWSPDGRMIAFNAFRGRLAVYVADADSSLQRKLGQNGAFSQDPSWAPDGRRLVYWSYVSEDSPAYVYSVKIDGTGRRNLTPRGNGGPPVWSPSGDLIAFSVHLGLSQDIYVMRSNGSELRRISRRGSNDSKPMWRPG